MCDKLILRKYILPSPVAIATNEFFSLSFLPDLIHFWSLSIILENGHAFDFYKKKNININRARLSIAMKMFREIRHKRKSSRLITDSFKKLCMEKRVSANKSSRSIQIKRASQEKIYKIKQWRGGEEIEAYIFLPSHNVNLHTKYKKKQVCVR